MIEISNADRGMLQAVLDNLRAADREEMTAAGVEIAHLAGMLMRHKLFAFCAWSYERGPISAWGLVQKRQGVGAAFAFGTDDWGQAVLPMVRQICGFAIPYLLAIGIHRVEAVAMRKRTDIKRFMKLLGARSEGILSSYGIEGEDFVSYRWLSDEYVCDRAEKTQADSAYTAH